MANYVRLNDSELRTWYHKNNKVKKSDVSTSNSAVLKFKVKCKDCKRVFTIDNATKSYITNGFTCTNCGKGVQGSYNHYRNIPPSVQEHVIKRDKKRCVYCNRRGSANNPLEWGHHIPHSSGGCTCAQNIQLECRECNRWKTERWVLDNDKTVKGCKRKCFNKYKTDFSKIKHKSKFKREKINKKYFGVKLKTLLAN